MENVSDPKAYDQYLTLPLKEQVAWETLWQTWFFCELIFPSYYHKDKTSSKFPTKFVLFLVASWEKKTPCRGTRRFSKKDFKDLMEETWSHMLEI